MLTPFTITARPREEEKHSVSALESKGSQIPRALSQPASNLLFCFSGYVTLVKSLGLSGP